MLILGWKTSENHVLNLFLKEGREWPHEDTEIDFQPILPISEELQPFTYKTVQALEHLADVEEQQKKGT